MHRLTEAVGSVVGKATKMVHRGASAEERRQAFSREFGQYPPHYEASKSEQEQFGREVVQPVLTQRAQAVQQAEQDRGQQSASGTVDQAKEAAEAFDRAYQLAVDLKFADRGKTYQDYLGQRG